MSEPRFNLGDLVRPTIRELDHNIMVVEGMRYNDSFGGWDYFCCKGDCVWRFVEDKLDPPDPLDALASL
jgi:hypothetical protein